MLSPSLLLAWLLSSIYATIFHLWKGGSVLDLLLYLVAAWLGFGLGQLVGNILGLGLAMIGPLNVVEGTLFAWLLLFGARWLKIT
jgi:hypothetical protein